MLRTNCKKAIENIRRYIVENVDFSGYDRGVDVSDWKAVKKEIWNIYTDEVGKWREKQIGRQNAFFEWCQGLPSVLDTCHYYNRSAKNDVAEILEENEAEKEKYTEEEAEKLLTWLIFRELSK